MSQSDDSPALQEPRLAKRLLREQLRLAKRELAQDERDNNQPKYARGCLARTFGRKTNRYCSTFRSRQKLILNC